MKTVIHVSTGAANEAVAGFPTEYAVKGYRIVPLLAASATVADLVAVYGNLTVRTTRNSQARYTSGLTPPAVTEDNSVLGPDWVRSPGFSTMLITAPAGNYIVQWADDCLEMINVLPPYLNGFTGASAPAAATKAEATYAATVASVLNVPVANEGVVLPAGCRGAYAVAIADAAQTVNSGDLVWWRKPAGTVRWAETPAQDGLAALARRDQQGSEKVINGAAGDRIFVEARNVVVSAGALNIYLVVY